MRLPIKDTGRTFHHKPNTAILMQTSEYRSTKKRDHTPPISDPLSVEKTETNRNIKSTYHDTYANEQYTNNRTNKVEVRSKGFDLSPNHVLKASPRYHNPSPIINKKNDYTYYNLENVPKTQNQDDLKKFLRNKGINPVSVTVYEDTITHQNNGKGFIVMNSNDTRINDMRTKLESNGITMCQESKLKNVHHHK